MNKREIIFLSLIILSTWILYHKTLEYDLMWDSKAVINQNALLKGESSLLDAFRYGYWEVTGEKASGYDYYRPLLSLSLLIEKRAWGLSPAKLRSINLIIFSLALLLLYAFFKGQNEQAPFAEMATALFAFFPGHVDNIIWVVSRGDLLMLLWGIFALFFLDRYIKQRRLQLGLYSSLCFAAGILSKEATVFLLPFLVLYEYLKRRRISFGLHVSNTVLTGCYLLLRGRVIEVSGAPFHFQAGFLANTKTLIASFGYYFRSLILPLSPDLFMPADRVVTHVNLLLGAVGIAAFLVLIRFGRGRRERLIPIALIIIVLSGHLLAVCTSLFPFSIYTRYLLVPSIGFVWIISHYLLRMNKKVRYAILTLILLVFIPHVYANTDAYRDESTFWERNYRSAPENSFVLFKYAQTFFLKGEYLPTELLLKKAMNKRVQAQTAVAIGLTVARIEFEKANYMNSFLWVERLKSLRKTTLQQLALIDLESSLYLSQGMCDEAEKILRDSLRKFKRETIYLKLYHVYLGCNLWEKAGEMEKIIRAQLPHTELREKTEQLERDFKTLDPLQKVDFYIRYHNYHQAQRILESLPPRGLDQEILLAKLLYRAGNTQEGRDLMERIRREHDQDFMVLNRLGDVYLTEFSRLEEALIYFDASIKSNPYQPEILAKRDYLQSLSEGDIKPWE